MARYLDKKYDPDKQGHLLDRIFKLQQENAELKARVESLAKIKADAISEFRRVFVEALCSNDGIGFEELADSIFHSFTEEYINLLKQDV